MLKKIIITSAIIFVIGFTSCSMWDDVDMNARFVIPVANINVDSGVIYAGGPPNPAQWNDVPVLFNTFTVKGSNTADKDITEIKIATNPDHSKIFLKITASSPISFAANFTSYAILFSKDYNCEGKKIDIGAGLYSIYNICETVIAAPTIPYSATLNTTGRVSLYAFLEISIDVNAVGLNLSNGFMLSVYSTNSTLPPYLPIKT
jgi:hypothetical protein